jgi:predicted component of type VI protein secretion system
MKAELVPENGDPPIPILRDLTLLGRHEDCDVVIGHPSLSKRHCILVKTDGLLVIRDLATTNGTKVKGQRVRWAALLPEDRVSFGAYKMRIYLGSDEMPSPSEVRRGRSRGGPERAPNQIGYPSGGKTELSPPSRAPALVAPSFPEPSHDDAEISWDSTQAESAVEKNDKVEPLVVAGAGFELVDDEPDAGDAAGPVFDHGFELVDDEDDDIIELE